MCNPLAAQSAQPVRVVHGHLQGITAPVSELDLEQLLAGSVPQGVDDDGYDLAKHYLKEVSDVRPSRGGEVGQGGGKGGTGGGREGVMFGERGEMRARVRVCVCVCARARACERGRTPEASTPRPGCLVDRERSMDGEGSEGAGRERERCMTAAMRMQ